MSNSIHSHPMWLFVIWGNIIYWKLMLQITSCHTAIIWNHSSKMWCLYVWTCLVSFWSGIQVSLLYCLYQKFIFNLCFLLICLLHVQTVATTFKCSHLMVNTWKNLRNIAIFLYVCHLYLVWPRIFVENMFKISFIIMFQFVSSNVRSLEMLRNDELLLISHNGKLLKY